MRLLFLNSVISVFTLFVFTPLSSAENLTNHLYDCAKYGMMIHEHSSHINASVVDDNDSINSSKKQREIKDIERDALVVLYNATDGDNWTDNTNWLSDEPVWNWYGINTNAEGYVNGIFLDQNNLSGSLPSDLGNLTYVSHIYLHGNQLTGSIPSELGNLSNLNFLLLALNQLSGSIPPELGNLTNLIQLKLHTNQLSGSIPPELGNLTNLLYFELGNNQLSGSIPAELGNLTNVSFFELYANQLSGSIPSELGNLTNLGYLALNINQLTGSIPSELGNLTNLRNLDLFTNQLTGSIPSELGNLTKLISLTLSYNQLSGAIPPELGNLTNLNWFDIRDNQFDVFPSELNTLNLSDAAEGRLNYFTFEDLLNFPEGMKYNPQKTISVNDTVELTKGVEGTIQLDFDNDVENSTYNWYKNGSFVGSTYDNHLSVTESTTGSYHYTLEITNTGFSGFILEVDSIIVEVKDSDGVDDDIINSIEIYSFESNLVIKSNGNPLNGKLLINDMSGRKVFEKKLDGITKVTQAVQLSSGYYSVQYILDGRAIVKKVYFE